MRSKNVVLLILAFALIFMGYDSSQAYMSSIFYAQNAQQVSFISLSLVYVSFVLSPFFAPSVVRRFGLKKSLIASSLAYPLFILSIVLASVPFLYITSVLTGLAAGVLWTAHGTYLNSVTTEKNRGFISGIAFSFLPFGTAIVLFGMGSFVEKVSYPSIYTILLFLALAGSIVLFFLSDVPFSIEKKKVSFHVLKQKELLLSLLFVFATAFGFGLVIGVLPIRATQLFGLSSFGFMGGLFMLTLVVFSFILGKLGDKFGLKKFVLAGILVGIVGLLITRQTTNYTLFTLGVFFLGLMWSSMLALSYPLVGHFFKKDVDAAMAMRWMSQPLGVFLGIVLALVLSFNMLVMMGIALLVISFFGIVGLKMRTM